MELHAQLDLSVIQLDLKHGCVFHFPKADLTLIMFTLATEISQKQVLRGAKMETSSGKQECQTKSM